MVFKRAIWQLSPWLPHDTSISLISAGAYLWLITFDALSLSSSFPSSFPPSLTY